MESEQMSNFQFQQKLSYLQQQISEFEKLDLEHKRTKSLTWLETEKKYIRQLEQTKNHACIVQDAKVRLMSPNLAGILGYTPEEVLDTLMIHYVHLKELPRLVKNYIKRMAGEDVSPIYKTVLKHKDGSRVYVEVNAGVIPYRGKQADFAIVKCLTRKN